MTSTRPYLLRALHEWMLDNDLTPQLVVDAASDDVQVPRQFVDEGRIVLNVSPSAVRDLSLGNDFIDFKARFAGSPFTVSVPTRRVLAIVARENGAGMTFPDEPDAAETGSDGPSGPDEPPPKSPPGGRPALKVVK